MTDLERAVSRLVQGNESDKDIEYLKTFSQAEILATIRSIKGNTQQTAKGSWNPENGEIRNGQFYGKD